MGGQLEIQDVFPEGDVRITRFQTLVVPNTEWDSRHSLMADNILPFPLPYRGALDPRWMALAAIGFQAREGQWQRGRVILTDAEIDQMDPQRWAQCLRRWTTRRPRVRE